MRITPESIAGIVVTVAVHAAFLWCARVESHRTADPEPHRFPVVYLPSVPPEVEVHPAHVLQPQASRKRQKVQQTPASNHDAATGTDTPPDIAGRGDKPSIHAAIMARMPAGDGIDSDTFRPTPWIRKNPGAFSPNDRLGSLVQDTSLGGRLQAMTRRQICKELRAALSAAPVHSASIIESMEAHGCN